MNETLLIRADASPEIGWGHVMRCLALAQAWRSDRGRVVLAMGPAPEALEARLQSEGIEVARISTPGGRADARETSTLAREIGARWVVVDGYHFQDEYQRIVKEAGLNLLVLDDYGHASHCNADVVLNQNLHAGDRMYGDRGRQTRLLLGPKYALLRQEFILRSRRLTPERPSHVLVTLGGSDPDNATLTVLRALQYPDLGGIEAKVVVGASNPHAEELRRQVAQSGRNIELVTASRDMPDLMSWADVAVSAGGSTCWELAYIGVPMLTIVLAENQAEIAASLEMAGAAVGAGWHTGLSAPRVARQLSAMLASPSGLREMGMRGRSIVDGRGAYRVASALTVDTAAIAAGCR